MFAVLLPIILLNLVIAIVSEVFGNVHAQRIEIAYMLRANLIADVWTTFLRARKRPEAKHQFIFVATEDSGE